MTLVDRNDYHQFQPLLYQVATSQLPAEDIARPHRTIFRDYPTVEVVTGAGRRRSTSPTAACTLADGRTRHRVAPGDRGRRAARTSSACPGRPSTPSRSTRSPTPSGCGCTSRSCCEAARQDAPRPTATLDVVVVGGGPTGVEIDRRARRADDRAGGDWADRRSRGGSPWSTAASALLGAFSEKSHKYAHKRLTKHGRRAPARAPASPPCTPTGSSSTTAPASAPGPWSGAAASRPRRSSQRAGLADRPRRPDRRPARPHRRRATRGVYAVGDVANIPGDATARRCPSSARSPSSPVAGPRENILRELRRRADASRSTTRTRASWR